MAQRWVAGVGIVVGGAATAACQQNACNGEPYRPVPGTPQILNIEVSQPLTAHEPPYTYNPWQLLLDVEFEDSEGNLGEGMAFIYLHGSRQVARSFALDGFFRTSSLPLEATHGHLGLYMLLPTDQINDGTVLQMGVQLEDASAPDPGGKFSNCYRMNLDFFVKPLQTAWRRLTARPGSTAHG